MTSLRKLVIVAASVVAVAACAQTTTPANVDVPADKTAIDLLEAAFYKAYNSGDGAAMATLYAEDAVLNAPGMPALRGRAAIGQFFVKDAAEAAAGGLTESDGAATEVGVCGDLAWRWGTYQTIDKSGATVNAGKYLTVFRRRDGKWRIFRDTWNSDSPAAAAPAPASSN